VVVVVVVVVVEETGDDGNSEAKELGECEFSLVLLE
jgi:hypothetical protein